jgi:hypothetical protein
LLDAVFFAVRVSFMTISVWKSNHKSFYKMFTKKINV